jgi:pseudomonalisin
VRFLSIFLLFVVTGTLAVSCRGAVAQAGSNAVAIDDRSVVTLAGNTHPLARPENDRGAVIAETRLERMMLLLAPDAAQQQDLDELVAAQQDPDSAQYHQWLTPEEYGSRFGVSATGLALVTTWLQRHGFSVDEVPPGRRLILFSGTAGQVANAFHTEIHRYVADGEMHIANDEDPQIPSAIAPLVAGIVSLHDFRRASATVSKREMGLAGANPANTQGSTHYLLPADFATIYDLNPQYAAGWKGSGVSVAIVGRSNILLSDVAAFRSSAGLPPNQPAVVVDGLNPGLIPDDQDEATLDVEWVGGIAPAAAVTLVAAASTAVSDGVDLAAQYIVNHRTAQVMSTSFGSCEATMGATELAFYNSLWEQAASEGISALVASGDSGASGCDVASDTQGSRASVNGLCSSPYATCVGGTEFDESAGGSAAGSYWGISNGADGGSARSYIPEVVWNESGSNGGRGLWSSGGGISEIYAQPDWQKNVVGAVSRGMRAVPDVALTSAVHDGYLVYLNGSWYVFGGTSAASPSFAAILALVAQKQGGTGQKNGGLGNANPTLYGLLSANENPFHATPGGDNSVPGVSGFTASGAAYNLATGMGSVDVDLLMNNWPTAGRNKSAAGFTVTPSIAALSVLPDKSATFTVAVGEAGGFSGMVALTASAPQGVTVTFAPTSVKAGSKATVTVTATSSSAAGTANVTITGTNGAAAVSATVGLTVLAVPKLSVSVAANKVTVTQGKTAVVQVTATTAGPFIGKVTLAVSGLPAGVSASWSANTFLANGAANSNSTLTLMATGTAALKSATLQITAAGDGLQAQTQCVLQVVTAVRGIAVRLSPTAISMQSTSMQRVAVTIIPQGGVKPATAAGSGFQLTGLPKGVTAVWSSPDTDG